MKSFLGGGLVAIVLLLAPALASAQTAEPVSMVKPTSGAFAADSHEGIAAQAASINRDEQLAVLQRVKAMIDKKPLSPSARNSAYAALSELAFSGTVHPAISGMTVINSYPEVRMLACRLLGQLGGTRASQTLIRVLFTDSAPIVLSEAAFQLGQLGKNPDNTVTNAIVFALAGQDARSQDNNLAFSSLLAFQKLAESNHGISDPEVYDVIKRIMAENYVIDVKEKAEQVLTELQSYN